MNSPYLPILAILADNIQIPIMNGVCTLSKSIIEMGKSTVWNTVGVGEGGGSFSVIVDVSVVAASVAT